MTASFLAGGGELGSLMRAKDWAATPLGPVEGWPQSLRSAVSILLPSRAQIALFWGPELITLYNDAYRPVFGGKHPHALGRPIRESWSELWRDGLRELFENVLATGEAFWASARPFYLERHGYPEETFFDVSYDPVRGESGRVEGVFCIVNEVTGRVRGERRLEVLRRLAAVTASSPEDAWRQCARVLTAATHDVPFAELDADGARAWPQGRHDLAALPDLRGAPGPWPEPPRSVLVLPLPAHADGEPGGKLALGLGSRLPFDDEYRGFCNLIATHVGAALAAARAVAAERRRAEQLAELDRAKTTFFSNVSHEFRTPLTLMLGPIEDALADAASPLPAGQRERLELVHRSGLRLQKLVNSLLDFSRIEAGRADATPAETDLAVLTAEIASGFRSAMEQAGLRYEVDTPPLGEPAWVDRDMWEKIVLNLLSNAFKHTFTGGVRVRLTREGGDFVLEVADTGTGIPPTELPHVFERFHRVAGARSRTHEGTGIGLSVVQELVRLHGGTVSVESEEGRGSVFRVAVPRGRAHLPAERIGAPRTLSSTAVGSDSFLAEALRWLPDAAPLPRPATAERRKRIVWADDNADMRQYVQGLLQPIYDVESVADGESALAAIRARRPDLVLADVMMPRVDGIELVRRLRADPVTAVLPVLLLSARTGEEARIEGFDAGADEYLDKPFSARALRSRVASLLRAAELRDDHARIEAALRESERRLETLIANLPGMAYRCPAHAPWPLVFASEGVLQVTGRPASAFMANEVTWVDIIDEADLEAVGNEVESALAARRSFEMTYRIRHADGSLRWVLDRGRGIEDPNTGEVVAIEGFLLDLTRQREAEEALRDSDRRKDEFLATLAHELRNPLAPLSNALALLRAGGAQGSEVQVRAMMERQLGHLVRLVDDLLEVSRISRGSLELRRERVALATVVANAVETSRPLIDASGHRLELSLPEEAIWIDGDPVRLAQILANLLNNAAKYTSRGGRIELDVRRDGGEVAVEVRDNGAGIAQDVLPRIFEMFLREERTSARAQGGLGIGLALARRLAEMHGGSLDAHSEGVDRGARFVLRLPLAGPDAHLAGRVASPAVAACDRRILLVDDNRDAALSLGMLLQQLGADVHIVHDGPAALAALGVYEPQVVLLDIGMPGMDGYELARHIRTRYPSDGPLLVALTGWGQEADRRRAREAGFDHHLVKPADLDELQSVLAHRVRDAQRTGSE